MKIKPPVGIQAVPDALQGLPLRRLKPQGIPVDINSQSIPPGEHFSTIGIQHRKKMQGDLLKQSLFFFRKIIRDQKIKDIEQSHSSGGFIPMHLGPQENRSITCTNSNQVKVSAFYRFAYFFNCELFP